MRAQHCLARWVWLPALLLGLAGHGLDMVNTKISGPPKNSWNGNKNGGIQITLTVKPQVGETVTSVQIGYNTTADNIAAATWLTPVSWTFNASGFFAKATMPAGTVVATDPEVWLFGRIVTSLGTYNLTNHKIGIDNDDPEPATLKKFGRSMQAGAEFYYNQDFNLALFSANPLPFIGATTDDWYNNGDTSRLTNTRLSDAPDKAMPIAFVCDTQIPLRWIDDPADSPATLLGVTGYPCTPGYPITVIGRTTSRGTGDTAYDNGTSQSGIGGFRVICDQIDPSIATHEQSTAWRTIQNTTYPATASLGEGPGAYWIHVRTFDANVQNPNYSETLHYGPIYLLPGPEILTCPAPITDAECGDPLPTPYATVAEFIAAGGVVQPEDGWPAGFDAAAQAVWLSVLTITHADVVIDADPCRTVITRTYTIRDDCLNAATCDQSITVVDTKAPEIVCPPDASVECGGSTDPDDTGWATANDACQGALTPTYEDSLVDDSDPCAVVFTRTWTAADGCGNENTCAQTITIIDTTAPAIECPPNVTVECGASTAPADTGSATAHDVCQGVITPTYSDSIDDTNPCVIVITRTWTANDGCGNENTCAQTITITDTTPPQIECPANVTVECGSSTLPTATEYLVDDGFAETSFGGVDADMMWLNHFTALPGADVITAVRVTYGSTGAGTGAIIGQPGTVALYADPNGDGDPSDAVLLSVGVMPIPAAAVDTGVFVDVPVPPTLVTPSFFVASLVRTWGTWPAPMDQSSSAGASWFAYHSTPGGFDILNLNNNDYPPVLIDTYSPGYPSNWLLRAVAAAGGTGLATATDVCQGALTPTYGDAIDDSNPCGVVITRTWTAADGCGNTATCQQTVTIVDTTAPSIECPANVTVECGSFTDPLYTGSATASDICQGTIIPTYSDSVDDTDPCAVVITRTWTANDGCGNENTCAQTITIVDTTAPYISCPSDVTVECGASTLPADTGSATAHDICQGVITPTSSDSIDDTDPCAVVITRTWTADDGCGNVNTCAQTITIVDTTAPAIECPASVTVECGASTLPADTGVATANDVCQGAITPTSSDSIDDTDPCAVVITRTWTANDGCGNENTCQQTITIVDTTAPAIECPANVTVECGDSTLPADTGVATANDVCQGAITPTSSDSIDDTDPCAVVITRTWTANDGCGNENTCAQTITVVDTTAPAIECPASVTVECGASTLPADTGSATANDICQGAITPTSSDSIDDTNPCAVVITRTWTANDGCGNVNSCDQTITIVDTTAPAIECPANATVECGASTLPAATGSATANDICQGAITPTSSDSIDDTDPCAVVITRTWTANDGCGNENTCQQTITIVDTTAPGIQCPANVTVECGASTLPADTGVATANDVCQGAITPTYSDATNDTNPCAVVITRTWTANDGCGNSASCAQTITIVDTTAPSIECPANTSVECGASTLPADTGVATANDVCQGAITPTSSDSIDDTDPCAVVITRTWTANDGCGNVNTCDQTITVVDTTAPDLRCPPDVTVECGQSTDPAATGLAVAHDACQGDLVPSADDAVDDTNPCAVVITRTWTADDGCGNVETCIQTITVVDTTAPEIQCPPNVTVECGQPTTPGHDYLLDDGTAENSVGLTAGGDLMWLNHFTAVPGGDLITTVQVTYGSLSFGGNAWLIGQPGTVALYADPNGDGDPSDAVLLVTAGLTIPAAAVDTGVFVDVPVPPTLVPSSFFVAALVTHPIGIFPAPLDQSSYAGASWLVGNSTPGGFVMTNLPANTLLPPTTTGGEGFPGNWLLRAAAAGDTGYATATDVCQGVLTPAYSDSVNDTNPCAVVITRTWTAEDGCGNHASCAQTITVVDTTAPAIECPANVTVECGASTLPADTGSATANDVCQGAVTPTYSDSTDDTNPCAVVITRTWTANDGCGNENTCAQTITIVDTTAPSIECPASVTVECGASTLPADTGVATANDICQGAIAPTSSDSIDDTDPCAVVITRTWTANDGCGNENTCAQTITVVDTTAPDIQCPPDTSVECGASTLPADTGVATANDVCQGALTPTYSDSTDDTDPCAVVITRTWTANDGCGNEDSCEQTITVVDTTAPAIQCPPDTSVECGSSTDPVYTGVATADDVCQGAITPTYGDVVDDTNPCAVVITRTWTADDGCGNVNTCDQTITVVDTAAPQIECPSDIEIPCGTSTDPDNTGWATANDVCQGAVTPTYSDSIDESDPCQVMTVTRTWTADDGCGHTASCVQTITVVDQVTVSVGTGYTIMYPTDEDSNPSTPPTGTPFELAGPGNWVTVPISASHCEDLAQLVFEIRFPTCGSDLDWPCEDCNYRYGTGLEYMAGTESWNEDRVRVSGPFEHPDWVNIEYGVAEDGSTGRIIVYIDSPSGEPVLTAGSGEFMWLMFRVCDSFFEWELTELPLEAEVIYATNACGLEVLHESEDGVVYADECNWLLDVDRNGRVEAETDGVTLYRALKYGHITGDESDCPVVPILPPDYAAEAGAYLPCDALIVDYVLDLLDAVDLNVDGNDDGIPDAIGGEGVSASRDGVYVYRNLAAFPTCIYPPYAPPAPYSPLANPWVPDMASRSNVNVTVPAAHTDNTDDPADEDDINDMIDVLKVMICEEWPLPPLPPVPPPLDGGSKALQSLDLPFPEPLPEMPCWWIVMPGDGDVDGLPSDNGAGFTVLPLPQAPWTMPCPPHHPPNGY